MYIAKLHASIAKLWCLEVPSITNSLLNAKHVREFIPYLDHIWDLIHYFISGATTSLLGTENL